jgi:NIPSNAP
MMTRQRVGFVLYSAIVFVAGLVAGELWSGPAAASAQAAPRVFELRTYTAPDGKLADLHQRFRDHTLRIFARHGMTNVIYLSPQDAPLSSNTLIYLLAHPSREAAKKSWSAFASDPEWKKVASESQINGRILSKAESIYLDPTDYSPMK